MPKKQKEPKVLYFVGINGVAMTGLAIMAQQLGYEVSGSDDSEEFPTDELLRKHNIRVNKGFDAQNLQFKPDVVVVSAAYGLSNPEVKAAKSLRLTIKPQSEVLGDVMSRFEGVGVAGVHGKTTTSSLLAFILKEAGFSPSYAIGAPDVPGLEGNAVIGDGKYFVAEADEYRKSDQSKDPKFLDLPLKHVIITSIELDHPDIYETAEDVYQAFYRLSVKIPRDGTLVVCVDSPLVRRLVQRRVDLRCLTYGFSIAAQYQIVDVDLRSKNTTFDIKVDGKKIGPFSMQLPGNHNVLNAAAAIVMARNLGVSLEAVKKSLPKFIGPKRRFELMGTVNEAEIYQDYAHHPTAIDFLLEAARNKFPGKRLICVFQPHTYSRTGKLIREFAESLTKADVLILLNIFASAREKSGYVTIRDLIKVIEQTKPDVEYRSSLDDAASYLRSIISHKDVVLLVGAGDVYKIFEKLNEAKS